MIAEDFDNMSVSDLITYITKTYHEPLRESFKRLDFLIDNVNVTYLKKYPDLFRLNSLYKQFKTEILRHVTREDLITFPSILRFEKIYTDELIHISDNYELMSELINDTEMSNQHNEFNLYLNKLITFVEWFKMSGEDSNEINLIRSILVNLQKDNLVHSRIEDKDLYFKWKELQNKLKEKLSNMN